MFLINAPAGSGKTTYIENKIISYLSKYSTKRILCITYTNRAKEELKGRIDNKNVTIDTIHSFISGFVSRYFSKPEIIELYFKIFGEKIEETINKGTDEAKNVTYIEKYGAINLDTIKKNLNKIYYNEQQFSSYYYGGLSHTDILLFGRKIFDEYPIMRKRLSDKYSYIFIDEYQDTSADILYLFYQSILGTNSKLYLFGDKMQEIYSNYDGSFDDTLHSFNQEFNLCVNYRCSSNIVKVLNNLYNDERYEQIPNDNHKKSIPSIEIIDTDVNIATNYLEDYMQLYLFNRDRFEKIGTTDLYNAVSRMSVYKFPSQYTPVDVLTDRTSDNPDRLFRILFCICEFIELNSQKAYGKSIRLVKEHSSIFNRDFVNIKFHNDKLMFAHKICELEEQYNSETFTIQDFCDYLVTQHYCVDGLFTTFIENEEYQELFEVPLSQLNMLYAYLNEPKISTQHGVKGEGHDNICFIAEDSRNNPIVHMYDFFKLLCTESINLTDFQSFYYDFLLFFREIDMSHMSSAKVYNEYQDKYIKYANSIYSRYKNNKYFIFCLGNAYNKYFNKPNYTNAKECFKSTKIKGVLWAYKLFYVGCSRAKENLTILVDEKRISPFKDSFISKMTSIGFCIKNP